jgi:hypothetical protein
VSINGSARGHVLAIRLKWTAEPVGAHEMTWGELIQAGQLKGAVWVVRNHLCGPKLDKFDNFSELQKYYTDHYFDERDWEFYTNYWLAWADLQNRVQSS